MRHPAPADGTVASKERGPALRPWSKVGLLVLGLVAMALPALAVAVPSVAFAPPAAAAGAPTVTAVSPASGPSTGGNLVTITGTGFTGATVVTFGASDLADSFNVVSATQINAAAPVGPAGAWDVQVETPSGTSATSSADLYTFVAAPGFISASAVAFNTQISGSTQVLAATQNLDVMAGGPFQISATSTQFVNGASETLPNNSVSVPVSGIGTPTCNASDGANGCTAASDTIALPYVLPSAAAAPAATTMYSSNTGMEAQTFPVTWDLALPVGTYAGAYTSTWTYTIAIGPGGSQPNLTPPIGVTLTPSSGQVLVSWNSEVGATSYTVFDNGTSGCTSTGTSCTVTGLTNTTQYVFEVVATNANGSSQPSGAVMCIPEAPPAAPTGVSATALYGGATVSFTAPVTQAPQQPIYYTIYANGTLVYAGAPASPVAVGGLTGGIAYTFTVAAIDSYGQTSPLSTASAAVTPSVLDVFGANPGSDSVTDVDGGNWYSQSVTTGSLPEAVVVSAAGYAYVANYTSGTVSVVSAATEKVVATVTVALGVTSETLSSNGSYLFVGTSSGALYLVNTSTNTVVTGTGLPAQAGTAAINYLTTGANGYVYAEGSGAAYAINQSTYAVTAITVGSTGDQIRGAVVTSNGSTLYVSDYTAGTVYPVNTGTDTVGTAITVGTQPIGLALSSTGATLYVANGGSANITPVTTSSNTAGTAIPVAGSAPQYLAVTASYIYVSSNTNNLYEVSIASSSLVQVRTTASTSAINDIALNGSGTFLYWSHSTTNTLTIISTAVPTTATTTLAANLQPAGSAMSPNGNYVWVSSGGGSATEISVISVATNAVVGTIPVVYNPTSLVFNPAGTDVWVAASYFDEVQEFAVNATQSGVTSTSPVQNISTGQTDMNGITISPSGQYVYTAAWGSNNIVEISTSTNAVVATLTVGSEPNYMAVTNSGSQVWVTNWAAGTISVVTVGSGGALSILTTLTVGSDLQGLVPSANGVSMYVAVEGASQLWVFNISTLAVTSQITVGVLPIGIGESPDGNFVFTANYSSGNISVISISANSRVATIPAGTDCSGIAVSGGLGAGSI